MSSEEHAAHLHTHCRLCGFPFEQPTEQEVCATPAACERRGNDPTYRVPDGRLTAVEERVRQYLIERAKAQPDRPFEAMVTYSDLCRAIDPDQHYWKWPRFRGIGKALGRISTVEHHQGRPLLSALVVQKDSHHAGPGFAQLGQGLGYQIQPDEERTFWRTQLEEVVRYWTGPGKDVPPADPTARALALLATIAEELQEVRRLLGAA